MEPTSPQQNGLAPPTPAPSSPGESLLDGGEFFHEKDYLAKSQQLRQSTANLNGAGGGGGDAERERNKQDDEELELEEEMTDGVLESPSEFYEVGEDGHENGEKDDDDEEEEEGEEEEGDEDKNGGLMEVWPEPKEDEHAYVPGEPGGVRRRRTVGLRGSRPSTAGSTESQSMDGSTKRKRIRFAPLRIPIRRRLQTLSVLWHELALGLFLTTFWFSLPNPLVWPLLVPYLLHLLLSTSHASGATPYLRSKFLRSLPIWRYYNAYFPITLHRSAKLDPSKNYIFGYQPHGIISIGAWGCFTTDDGVQGGVEGNEDGYASVPGGGFGRLFPGIRNTLLTLDGNFKIPFYREYLLSMGLASVSRRSCEALLSGKYKDRVPRKAPKTQASTAAATSAADEEWTWKSTLYYLNPLAWITFFTRLIMSILPPFLPPSVHPYLPAQPSPPSASSSGGNAITIVLGGAHESLLTLPHHYRIILKRRRGFLKLALCTPNTHLVPVLAFGENDLYETLVPEQGTWLDKAQKGIKKWLGWTVPVFWARGVFNYDVGMVPFRRGIEVVCGRPVVPRRWRETVEDVDGKVEGKVEEPTEEEIDELQEEYIKELRKVWDDWKDVFAPGKVEEPTEEEIDELQEEYIKELRKVWDDWKDVFAPGRRGELEIVE